MCIRDTARKSHRAPNKRYSEIRINLHAWKNEDTLLSTLLGKKTAIQSVE